MFLFTPCRKAARKGLCGVFFLALAMLAPGFVLAQSIAASAPRFTSVEEVYTVRNVAVDEKDNTASAAREIAVRAARRMAFSRLSRRIVLPEDLARLPLPSDDALANLVTDFEVTEEKSSGQRYLAKLTLRFAPDKMRTLFQRANIRHSETGAEPVLVIPVLEGPAGRILWEANAWHDALGVALSQAGASDDRLAPLILPLGDFEDASAVTADQAAAGDRSHLDILMRRYKAADVLVMHAVQPPIAGLGGAITYDVSLSRLAAPEQSLQIERFEAGPGEPAELVLKRAALSLVRGIEDAWISETAMDFALQASLEVVAPLNNLQEWLAMQKLLKETPMIQQVELRTLSVQGAQVNLHYLGTPEKLAASLSKRGLALTQESGRWQLN